MSGPDPAVLTIDRVRDAARVLAGVAHRTPVLSSHTLDSVLGARVFLKCESFQRGGSFKFRGAYTFISSLPGEERERGVCTISSGNHAQAVAIASSLLGVRAAILMPEDAPETKVAATRGYGAEIETYDRYSMPQRVAGEAFAARRGMTFVPAYDSPVIAAGAGTAALELIDDAGPLDALVAPIGGGGGMSGYATVMRAMLPAAKVVGVEPAAGGATAASLAAGAPVDIAVPRTIADGQALTSPGRFTFAVMRERVDEVLAVPDEAVIGAMVWLFERMKLVVEPSGAMALAALLAGAYPVEGQRVGVIVSGGNIGTRRFADLTSAQR